MAAENPGATFRCLENDFYSPRNSSVCGGAPGSLGVATFLIPFKGGLRAPEDRTLGGSQPRPRLPTKQQYALDMSHLHPCWLLQSLKLTLLCFRPAANEIRFSTKELA
jgi:hypothetical protein